MAFGAPEITLKRPSSSARVRRRSAEASPNRSLDAASRRSERMTSMYSLTSRHSASLSRATSRPSSQRCVESLLIIFNPTPKLAPGSSLALAGTKPILALLCEALVLAHHPPETVLAHAPGLRLAAPMDLGAAPHADDCRRPPVPPPTFAHLMFGHFVLHLPGEACEAFHPCAAGALISTFLGVAKMSLNVCPVSDNSSDFQGVGCVAVTIRPATSTT